MRRQVLGVLALAAGWGVLVADGGGDWRACESFDVQYEFQTNCMSAPASGLLNLHNDSYCSWDEKYKECHVWVTGSVVNQIREQGLNVQSMEILYKQRSNDFIPIGFDFELIGKPVDAPNDPDTTAPTFICKDSRTHETLAVDKDYRCRKSDNPSETCELKLVYRPQEVQ